MLYKGQQTLLSPQPADLRCCFAWQRKSIACMAEEAGTQESEPDDTALEGWPARFVILDPASATCALPGSRARRPRGGETRGSRPRGSGPERRALLGPRAYPVGHVRTRTPRRRLCSVNGSTIDQPGVSGEGNGELRAAVADASKWHDTTKLGPWAVCRWCHPSRAGRVDHDDHVCQIERRHRGVE